MKRVTVFDYGAGNLHSLTKVLERTTGTTVAVEPDPVKALETEVLVLPGVGAFGLGADRLAPGRLAMRAAIAAGLPTIGICLGMQMLFEGSDEAPGAGLGVLLGRVTRLLSPRVPQIGWNTIEDAGEPLLAKHPLSTVYYANGYVCRPTDARVVTAWTTHDGDRFPAIVRHQRVLGVQFHPEKSSREGVAFVDAAVTEALR
jgi:glutamine amidotransferase